MKFNFDRRGTGSPLVLLHGIGHRWQAWEPVMDLLAERHDVIAVDLPGFGLSAAMPDGVGHDLSSTMLVLEMLFEEFGLDRPHMAGNSLGGLITVEAASRGMVASATLLSPAGFWSNRDKNRALGMLRAIRAASRAPAPARTVLMGNPRLRALSLSALYAHPERIDRRSATADLTALRKSSSFAPAMQAGRYFGAWDSPAPTVPVTVAWGNKDRILPPRQAQRAAQALPAAHHLTLPDCGHVPMIDNPSLVAKIILDTCAQADHISVSGTWSYPEGAPKA